jgi:hypothetical protein
MKIGNYQTRIFKALWGRIRPSKTHPPGAFWYPLEGWITDPKELERIMRERGLEL